MKLSKADVRAFQKTVWNFYRQNRRSFPWRDTRDPYFILVSEVMLQQTQTQRVTSFFIRFTKEFPTPAALARAPLSRVLSVWNGLGYNRRAIYLKKAAEMILSDFGGRVPNNESELVKLPGVGTYTASAVLAFSQNQPTVFLETNIRTVYLHHFFPSAKKVSDREILKIVGRTLSREKPREWYEALMDYGFMLKKSVGNVSRRSATYKRQPVFRGSRRQLRGRLISLALERPLHKNSLSGFVKRYGCRGTLLQEIINELVSEGFLKKKGEKFILA